VYGVWDGQVLDNRDGQHSEQALDVFAGLLLWANIGTFSRWLT